MMIKKVFVTCCLTAALCVTGCSRQQSDWEKTRGANTTDAYESFLKKYPSGEFAAQAHARVKELYEEHDWQKARDTDTLEAYQAFLKEYPEGKWTEEARIRIENFTLASAPSSGASPSNANPSQPGAPLPGAAAPSAAAPESPAASAAASGDIPTHATSHPAAQATAHAAARAAKTSAGGYGVQLGAFKSSAAPAEKHWARLHRDYPQLLMGMTPKVTAKKSASDTLYRLQVIHLSEKRANAVCKSLKEHSQPCILIHPERA